MTNIKLFEEQRVRSVWNEADGLWYFAVSDVVAVLTDSKDPKAYWRQLKKREPELVTHCHGLKLQSLDGKMRIEDCAHVEGMLRIIQSIPSPKAEPFKRWLARVGYERIEEIENPELAMARMRQIYEAKGYSPDWIEKRLRGIAVRDDALPHGKKLRLLANELTKSPADAITLTCGDWQMFPASDPQEPDLLTRQAQAFLAAVRGKNVALPKDAGEWVSGASVVGGV